MTENVIAIVMVFLALFLVGGVVSLIKQGMRTGAAVCGLGAAMALFAGVMWW